MDAILNVALPIFAIIALGFASGRFGLMGAAAADALNRYVFFIALPPAMFVFIARAGISEILNWPYIIGSALAIALTAGLALVVARLAFRADGRRVAFHGFMAVFANYGYMGIPFFLTAFGAERVLPALVISLAGGIPAMVCIMSVLEMTRPGAGGARRLGPAIWRTFARNPLFVAAGLGVVFSVFAVPVPAPAGNLLDMLALTAGPTALFALGLSLVGHSILGDLREVAWLVVLKLIVHPLATWLVITGMFEVDPFWTMSAVILAAMPLGPTSYVIAQQYGVAVRLSSAAVAVSTMGSVVTLSLLMVWLAPA